MNESRAEKFLALLYSSSTVLSIVSVVCLAVSWQHWKGTLDVCLNMDCGCILYGVTTFSTFMGGDVKVCTFEVFALVPVSIIAMGFAIFHGYRSCIERKLDEPRVVNQRIQRTYYNRGNGGGEMMVVAPKERKPFKQWMTTAFLAVIICCLCLSHAVVATDGYYKTCEQYKRNFVKLINAPSQMANVIYNRLDCAAILDYMDYMQPDRKNSIRGERINTRVALQLAIVTSWFNVFAWIAIFALNFTLGKRRLNSFGKRLCCCCS